MTSPNWDQFVATHYQAVYRYCFHFLGSEADGEDAVQKTFLKAWNSFSALKDPNAAKAWLYSIARNICIDQSRWWKRTQKVKESLEQQATGSKEIELSLTLRYLILKLPRKQKEVFILRHLHDFSTKETAAMLGIGEGTVKSHLSRAVTTLKGELLHFGYSVSQERTFQSPQPETTKQSSESSLYTKEGRL